VRSTQLAPHCVRFAAQTVEHWATEHTRSAGHAVAHLPQLAGSDCKSTQVVPHLVKLLRHWQLPAVHTWPCAHAVPHAPQLEALVLPSTQLAPQLVEPDGQLHLPLTHCCPAAHVCAHDVVQFPPSHELPPPVPPPGRLMLSELVLLPQLDPTAKRDSTKTTQA